MTDTIKTRLIGTVNGHDLHEGSAGLYATLPGRAAVLGVAWGPSADGSGNWFARRGPRAQVFRVESRDAAIQHITGGAA